MSDAGNTSGGRPDGGADKISGGLKDAAVRALETVGRMESVTGTPRLVATGGLLATCFVFVAAMLGLPRLDTPLQFALRAIAVAVPVLALDFMAGTARFAPGRGKFLTDSILRTGYFLGALVGYPAALLGIGGVVWHLNPSAVKLCGLVAVALLPAWVVVTVVDVMVRALGEYNRDKPAGDSPPIRPVTQQGTRQDEAPTP